MGCACLVKFGIKPFTYWSLGLKCLSLTCLRGSILHVLNCSATGTTKFKLLNYSNFKIAWKITDRLLVLFYHDNLRVLFQKIAEHNFSKLFRMMQKYSNGNNIVKSSGKFDTDRIVFDSVKTTN